MTLAARTLATPIGPLQVVADARGVVVRVRFDPDPAIASDEDGVCATAARQLEEYFVGRRRAFDVPLETDGTSFERRVWEALLEIPYGATTTYGKLAERIGAPGSARAVGRANALNPIPILIPCHRVIGADGSLVGYGGGLDAMRRLLDLESGSLSLL